MSDSAAEQSSIAQVELVAWHRPALARGSYQIQVTQRLSQPTNEHVPANTTFTTLQTFRVEGAGFSLLPTDVQALFPPDGNLGDHALALPHIVLARSTLPWERSAAGDPETPWLALLLFDEREIQSGLVRGPEVMTRGAIKQGATSGDTLWPALAEEPWQSDDEQLTVIDVRRSLLTQIAPRMADLRLLAHVRRGKDATGKPVGDARAVIVGNRLPQRSGISVAHLVSVEDRYDPTSGTLVMPAAEGDPYIRLVTLKSWRFASVTRTQNLAGLLQNLDREPSVLRLPLSKNPLADRYVSQGYVALPYTPRGGTPTAVWYRGPLLPCASGPSADPDARSADVLRRYDPDLDMYDISYAVAWDLGRSLILRSKPISVALYNWKRAHAQRQHQTSQRLMPLHSATASAEPEHEVPPREVRAWFENLLRLEGVPLRYLVPDPRLLPPESLRFFQIDDFWLDCLLDGAFSIGQTTTRSDVVERLQQQLLTAQLPNRGRLSGLLLRSEAVSGWPALYVDGSDQPDGLEHDTSLRLLRLRMERVAPNVLLCLFSGALRSVAIHLSPEALHFGIERLEATLGDRKSEWLSPHNCLNLASLAAMLHAATSADLARPLLAIVPRVLFAIEPTTAP
ncbi:MAG TPA: hypothetical protein VGD58_32155 [Herpetosiphonaceae bacterium]